MYPVWLQPTTFRTIAHTHTVVNEIVHIGHLPTLLLGSIVATAGLRVGAYRQVHGNQAPSSIFWLPSCRMVRSAV